MPQIAKSHDSRDEYARQYCRVESELLDGREQDTVSSWRIFKIMAEFVNGFELLRKYGLAASIFGSARSAPDMAVYKDAERMGKLLAEQSFTVITGGGGGVMEAANKGAFEAGGQSVGLNIRLPEEQSLNRYVTDSETFHYFFTRKVSLAFASEVYIYFPGGFGTLDELMELVTLIQTGKIQNVPVVLVGREYWEPLLVWFRNMLLEKKHTISEADMDIFHVVDSADEAIELIKKIVPCLKERDPEIV